MSSANRPPPVSKRASSRRLTGLPMPCGATCSREVKNDIDPQSPFWSVELSYSGARQQPARRLAQLLGSRAEPQVRIHVPPAVSHRRAGHVASGGRYSVCAGMTGDITTSSCGRQRPSLLQALPAAQQSRSDPRRSFAYVVARIVRAFLQCLSARHNTGDQYGKLDTRSDFLPLSASGGGRAAREAGLRRKLRPGTAPQRRDGGCRSRQRVTDLRTDPSSRRDVRSW